MLIGQGGWKGLVLTKTNELRLKFFIFVLDFLFYHYNARMFILSLSENILLFISCFGILQGFLLSVLLYFHPKSDRKVNKFLSFYIACLSIIMAGPLILSLIPWHKIFFMEPFTYLAGPLMYLYIRSYKEAITWRKTLPHISLFFLYFFVGYWWLSYLANISPGSETIPEEAFRSPAAIMLVVVRYSQLLLYYFMSRRELTSYQRSIHHLFSEISQIDLKWGRWLINGYLLIVITTIVLFPLMIKYPEYFNLLYLINIAIATPYVYIITYKGITQPTIWQAKGNAEKQAIEEQMHESEEIEKEIHEKQKVQKTGLPNGRINEIVSKITIVMDGDKLYQETELTLQDLAKKLDYPAHQVSQAINEGMKKNFYDLVNGYRVEEAKRLLVNPKNTNYTILSVGFEAGFNSKTTFNTVFKKFTGLTPTEFREKQKMKVAIA